MFVVEVSVGGQLRYLVNDYDLIDEPGHARYYGNRQLAWEAVAEFIDSPGFPPAVFGAVISITVKEV
jgi:hypothetical protein